MTSTLRYGAAILAVFGIAAAVAYGAVKLVRSGDGGLAEPASAGQARWTIEDAKQFRDFPLYWLGESYRGLPLTKITRYRYEPAGEKAAYEFPEYSVAFLYGDCEPGPDSGCPYPLQIIAEPYCMKPPELLASQAEEEPAIQLRGVMAQPMGVYQMMIWTGASTITVFGGEQATALEAAEDLAAVVDEGAKAGEPLPPADKSSC